jgi:Flp pilus assembly protein TadB
LLAFSTEFFSSSRSMLFYPTRRINAPSTRRGTSRPWPTAESDDAQRVAWILKSFAMGVTLLGLSYWLVQIAGVQYLASLTSATLLAFLLGYVVWCLLHRNRLTRQVDDSSNTWHIDCCYGPVAWTVSF